MAEDPDKRVARLADRMIELERAGGSLDELPEDDELRSLTDEDDAAIGAFLERWVESLRGKARKAEREAEVEAARAARVGSLHREMEALRQQGATAEELTVAAEEGLARLREEDPESEALIRQRVLALRERAEADEEQEES